MNFWNIVLPFNKLTLLPNIIHWILKLWRPVCSSHQVLADCGSVGFYHRAYVNEIRVKSVEMLENMSVVSPWIRSLCEWCVVQVVSMLHFITKQVELTHCTYVNVSREFYMTEREKILGVSVNVAITSVFLWLRQGHIMFTCQ